MLETSCSLILLLKFNIFHFNTRHYAYVVLIKQITARNAKTTLSSVPNQTSNPQPNTGNWELKSPLQTNHLIRLKCLTACHWMAPKRSTFYMLIESEYHSFMYISWWPNIKPQIRSLKTSTIYLAFNDTIIKYSWINLQTNNFYKVIDKK